MSRIKTIKRIIGIVFIFLFIYLVVFISLLETLHNFTLFEYSFRVLITSLVFIFLICLLAIFIVWILF